MKQKELSIWLRGILILLGFAVAFASIVVVPNLGSDLAFQNPELAFMYWPCLIYIWLTVIPVIIALFYAWRIFVEIGRDHSFCLENALRLKRICVLAIIDTVAFIVGGSILGFMRLLHPGILIVVVLVVFIGLAIAVATAALSHLTHKAAVLKDENDLTI